MLKANSDLIWISKEGEFTYHNRRLGMIKYNVVNLQGADDGVFWIAFEDVLTFFDCIDICKVSEIVEYRSNQVGGGLSLSDH